MRTVTNKLPPPIQPTHEANRQQFEAMCHWIHANAATQNIGWQQLTQVSGWKHQELIELFEYFLQTTPMTYLRTTRTGSHLADQPMVPAHNKNAS